ncbi:ABC transporter substrate-binding protein [Clostridium sp. SYSU_GA19001]|uniref:ABC transporter substrate-binding protein n=1 Tax=Clostridium caldaquaticum TaxID=2940653 RepID=UPI00207752B4|nr:ABC transporter substrate-binding protein [Clostridium caldaquaticum]MCM8712014.1 ABC transporter substrate-binding protein [Clostridium caldaquaticum]
MLVLYFINIKNNKPIIIGFAAQLTGKQAELGVQERNGVQMAIEEINESGGISGRKIKLLIGDDRGIPDIAQSVDAELIEKGAVAIIGHSTSSQTMAGLKVTNPAKVVMIGPTISTPELSDLQDFFFRVYPSFKDSAEAFTNYIYQNDGRKRLSIIYDIDNASYSKTYSKTVIDKFKSLGGNIIDCIEFSSASQPDFSILLSKLHEAKAEGLLIIASDMDTALIAQRTRLMGWNIPLYTSSWAPTENLINNGGQAVEGMKFEQAYGLTSQSETLLNFKAKYRARFGKEPSYGAALAYDSAMVLSYALKKTGGNSKGLSDALLETRNYTGLMGNFSFNEFGDVMRPFYLSSISNGKFITLDLLTSSN